MYRRLLDETGNKYGRLTVIELSYIHPRMRCAVWICHCNCGVVSHIPGKTLREGRAKSCGCLQKEIAKKTASRNFTLPYGESSFNKLFSNYKWNAEKKELPFSLSKTDFKSLTQKPCFWCGEIPKQVSQAPNCNGEFTYNGIDRLNNDRGYVIGNVVSCCLVCNFMKGSMNYQEFVNHLIKLLSYQKRV